MGVRPPPTTQVDESGTNCWPNLVGDFALQGVNMNLFLLSLRRESANWPGHKLIARLAGRTFRAACRAMSCCALSAFLWLSGAISSARAADYPPSPADLARSTDQLLDFKIKPVSQGMELSWFAREGVPCQVQSSTDLANWTDLGPIIAGTNGWVSFTVLTNQPASFMAPRDNANEPIMTSTNTGRQSFFRVKNVAAALEGEMRALAVEAFFINGVLIV